MCMIMKKKKSCSKIDRRRANKKRYIFSVAESKRHTRWRKSIARAARTKIMKRETTMCARGESGVGNNKNKMKKVNFDGGALEHSIYDCRAIDCDDFFGCINLLRSRLERVAFSRRPGISPIEANQDNPLGRPDFACSEHGILRLSIKVEK